MQLSFEKYHGAGNDFILVDNSLHTFPKETSLIAQLCHRHYGIGADGLILLEKHPDFDFEMQYYNADGRPGSMCGNGGRCAVIFARKSGFIGEKANFLAVDGPHSATIAATGQVKISMSPVKAVEVTGDGYVLNTGSPHLVKFMDNIQDMDVVAEGRKIRYGDMYRADGINVNFAELSGTGCRMRTYERGVENETLSCGTGTVAVAIAASVRQENNAHSQVYDIQAIGGQLKVYFSKDAKAHYTNIFLEGPVQQVFAGTTTI
ncbi:MAG: diaminopimelate epimerase [Chitinophagales bacterium]|nr:diaminopimelate epimerase [Chitinophagales bacterium]